MGIGIQSRGYTGMKAESRRRAREALASIKQERNLRKQKIQEIEEEDLVLPELVLSREIPKK